MLSNTIIQEVVGCCNKIASLCIGDDLILIKNIIQGIFQSVIQFNSKDLNRMFVVLFSTKMTEDIYYHIYQLFNIIYGDMTTDGKKSLFEYNKQEVDSCTEYLKLNRLWNPDELNNKITITMTTCKRYDLFRKTVISVLKCISDMKEYVHDWIVIDDNSSCEMRLKMKEEFPFITYIYKDVEDKGHVRSMNMFLKIVKTPYIFNIEDDWEFFFEDKYITKMMNVFKENPKYGQVLVNVNYSEDTTTYRNAGGSTMKYTKTDQLYFVHNYYTGRELNEQVALLKRTNSLYWPHFSLRVGLTRKSVLDELGQFDEKADHFEMNHAYKYVSKGYKTAFLESVYCLHIGRRTYERESDKLNAYDLNTEQQFGQKAKSGIPIHMELTKDNDNYSVVLPDVPNLTRVDSYGRTIPIPISSETRQEIKPIIVEPPQPSLPVVEDDCPFIFKTFVINLKRRLDRLTKFIENNKKEIVSFDVIEGFDGSNEKPTHKVMKAFTSSDYDYRCGLVGCVISHVKIFKLFLQDISSKYAIVMEDDSVCCKNFNEKIIYLLDKYDGQFEIMMLHQNMRPNCDKLEYHLTSKIPYAYKLSTDSFCQNLGSTAGYIITRKGAENVLNHLNKKGGYNGIDTMMIKSSIEQQMMYSSPFLVETPNGFNDTNIQNEFKKIKMTDMEWDKSELDYIYNMLIKSVYHETLGNKTITFSASVKKDDEFFKTYVKGCIGDLNVPGSFLKYTFDTSLSKLTVFYYPTISSISWNKLTDNVLVVSLKDTGSFLKDTTSEFKKQLKRYTVKWYYTNCLLYIIPDKYVTQQVLEDKVFGDNYLNFLKPF